MQPLSFLVACALVSGTASGVMSVARAGGPDAEAVTIDTNFTVYMPPVRLDKKPHNARASVILMARAATGCSASTAPAPSYTRPEIS
jgi:hypothetical protein